MCALHRQIATDLVEYRHLTGQPPVQAATGSWPRPSWTSVPPALRAGRSARASRHGELHGRKGVSRFAPSLVVRGRRQGSPDAAPSHQPSARSRVSVGADPGRAGRARSGIVLVGPWEPVGDRREEVTGEFPNRAHSPFRVQTRSMTGAETCISPAFAARHGVPQPSSRNARPGVHHRAVGFRQARCAFRPLGRRRCRRASRRPSMIG